MSDLSPLDDRPDGVRFELSPDRRTLKIERDTEHGVDITTTHYVEDPEPEQIYKAIHSVTKFRTLLPGEKVTGRKGRWFVFIVNTGPPTWWVPRLRIQIGRHWYIHTGWLNGAVSLSGAKGPRDK